MQYLVCVFTNKRPSVAAKTSPAPNNVPVQAFRRAFSIQAENPSMAKSKIDCVLPLSWTIA